MMLIMLAGLQSQPSDVLEAAKVDGATAVRHVPPADAAAPAPVHGARHPARHDLPDPGVRPDRGDDRRRARARPTCPTSSTSARSAAAGSSARRRPTPSSSSSPRSSSPPSRCACCPGCSRARRSHERRERATRLGVGETPLACTSLLGRRSPGSPALVFFFPVFWMVLNSFKDGAGRQHQPEAVLRPDARPLHATSPRSTHGPAVVPRGVRRTRSVIVIGQHDHRARCWPSRPPTPSPIKPIQKWRDVLFFFISTKFLPVVASILPLWIIARELRPAEHPARADHPLHGDEPAAGGLDAALVLPGDPARADRGGRDRRRRAARAARRR